MVITYYCILILGFLLSLVIFKTAFKMMEYNYINTKKLLHSSIRRLTTLTQRLRVLTAFLTGFYALVLGFFAFTPKTLREPLNYLTAYSCIYVFLLIFMLYCIVKVRKNIKIMKQTLCEYPNYNSDFDYLELDAYFKDISKTNDIRLQQLIENVHIEIFNTNRCYLLSEDVLIDLNNLNQLEVKTPEDLEEIKYLLETINNDYGIRFS